MVAELERRGLHAAVVTAPRAAQSAFAEELRVRRVTPLPGVLPPDMTHPQITVYLASRLRSECAVPTIFLAVPRKFVPHSLAARSGSVT